MTIITTCLLLVSLLRAHNALSVQKKNINLTFNKEELRFFFGADDYGRDDYDVVKITSKQREVRSTKDVTLNPGHLDVTVEDDTGKFDLELHPSDSELLSRDFKLVIRGAGGVVEQELRGQPSRQCLFTGNAKGKQETVAALSTCDGKGFTGVILEGERSHLIRPLAKDRRKRDSEEVTEDGLHVIRQSKLNSKCAIHNLRAMMAPTVLVELGKEDAEDLNQWEKLFPGGETSSHSVSKRQVPKKYKIETAVFTDGAMYDFIEMKDGTTEELENVVLAIMNGVNIIYNAPSMRTSISIVVVRLDIMKASEDLIDDAEGDIAVYLSNFCTWQQRMKKGLSLKSSSPSDSWDHGLLLSGIDLWDIDPSRNKVIGLAWVGGMCNSYYSCTINEGTSFEAQFVIAHEIGHNLNLSHDGSSEDGNNCPSDRYIMSPSTGPGKLSWSVCSNRELEHFISNSRSISCLESSSTRRTVTSDAPEKLPGEQYDIENQCTYALGKDFKPYVTSKEPYNSVCRELWCQNRSHAMRTHPALEGSTCDVDMYCVGGTCVQRLETGTYDDTPSSPEEDEASNEIPDSTGRSDSGNSFGFRDLFKRIRNMFRKYLLVSREGKSQTLVQWGLRNLTACSKTCGGGWQSGRVICERAVDGSPLKISQCEGFMKPSSKTSCNTFPCINKNRSGNMIPFLSGSIFG